MAYIALAGASCCGAVDVRCMFRLPLAAKACLRKLIPCGNQVGKENRVRPVSRVQFRTLCRFRILCGDRQPFRLSWRKAFGFSFTN